MIKVTVAENVISVLKKIPERLRKRVREVTMEYGCQHALGHKTVVNAHRVINCFHIQKLAYDVVQEVRIKYLWEAIDTENEGIATAKRTKLLTIQKC